ncbi:MAG: porin family protein [Flavobacteriales bacterium]|nr:porin family protein [Flavobacteriales bacterium]
MKNLFKLTAAGFAIVLFSFNANAQFNAGLDIALPMGDFADAASLGYGVSLGYEHKIGDNMGVGGEIGYMMYSTKDIGAGLFNDFSYSLSMVPILPYFKYYFTENTNGVYGKATLGMTLTTSSISYSFDVLSGFDANFNPIYTTQKFDDSSSDFDLTYGVGAGYLVNEKIDIAVEYRIIAASGSNANYLNFGAAYNF